MMPVAAKVGVPLVTHFRGYDVSKILPSAFWESEYSDLFSSVSGLIGISNYICDKLLRLGASPQKVNMLHTGVRLDNFPYDPPSGRYDGGVVRCLHVGRLVEKKSPLKLVRSFANACKRVGDRASLELMIAGDGPLREPTELLIRDLGLTERVHCIGNTAHEEVMQLMRTSHLHVKHCETASDGDQEGQGVTFVEASAIGLPIVTTRHNGIPDAVKDGETGYLVEEGDVDAMGERIAYLTLHPEAWHAIGQAGRLHVEENFDLRKQTQKLAGIYERVLARA
jgi:colanic acid/amylovoran biosynthesis glycosyltransferase